MGWAPSSDLDSRKVTGQCCQSSVSQTRKGWDPSANLTTAREPTMPSKRDVPEERGVGCLGTHIWVPTDSSCVRSAVREGRGLTTPKNNCLACLKSRQRSVCVGGGDPQVPSALTLSAENGETAKSRA